MNETFSNQNPLESVKTQLERVRRGKLLRRIVLIALGVLILALGGFFAWQHFSRDQHALDMEAFAGTLPGKTEAEIEADLNRLVKDSEFNVSMSGIVSIKGDKGMVNIENIAANHFLMQVDIVHIDENTQKKTVVYESGIIKPGYSVGEATMKNALPHTGDGKMTAYDGVATFHALDPETKRPVGATQVNVVLAYQNDNAEGK